MRQLLGTLSPKRTKGALLLDHTGGLMFPKPPTFNPQQKFIKWALVSSN